MNQDSCLKLTCFVGEFVGKGVGILDGAAVGLSMEKECTMSMARLVDKNS